MFHLPSDQRKTAIVAGTVGNVIEWYDFALYGYLATVLASLFFPSENRAISLLATYGVFAAGFMMRPLGAAVFGWLGDTIGRSRTLLLSVALMAVPTFAIGLLPTYEKIGVAAPILLVLIRLIQGFSVGGEFSSSVTYMVETAPSGQRGLSGSFANVGSMIGMLAGSGAAAAMTTLVDQGELMAWGWRIPFLIGGVTGIIATLLRRHLPESQQFAAHERQHGDTSPLKLALMENRKEFIQATLFASAYGSIFYLAFVYLPSWASEHAGVPLADALRYNTLAIALTIPVIPLAGWLSDRYVRRTHLLAGAFLLFGVVVTPLSLWMTNTGGTLAAGVSQIVCAVLLAVPCGVAPALFVELFPTRDRLSGYSVSFNVGLGVVGGSTPAVATWLIAASGSNTAPATYAVLLALVAAITLLWIVDRSREPLQ